MNIRSYSPRPGLRWFFADEYMPDLKDVFAGDFEILLRRSGSKLVKQNPERRILTFVGAKSGKTYYLKEYFVRGLKLKLKHFFTPSNAAKEWRATTHLADNGVPTIRPVAYAEERCRGILQRAYFVSENVDNALSLEKLIRGSDRGLWLTSPLRARYKCARNLAQSIFMMHASGLLHRDLHAGNILVHGPDFSLEKPLICDLHRVRIKADVTPTERFSDLAQLNMFFSYAASYALRLAFLKEYLRLYARPSLGLASVSRSIETQTHSLCHMFFVRRDRRFLKNRRHVDIYRFKGGRVIALNRYPRAALNHLLGDIDAALSANDVDAALLKSSRSTRHGLVTMQNLPGAPRWWVKRFNVRSLPFFCAYLFRCSRALKAWLGANRLLTRNFLTPAPVAVYEKRYMGLKLATYYICEFMPALERNLCHYLRLNWEKMGVEERSRFCAAFENFLLRLYRHGVAHGDLKGGNILVVENAARKIDFALLDTGDIVFRRKLKARDIELNRRQMQRSIGQFFMPDLEKIKTRLNA